MKRIAFANAASVALQAKTNINADHLSSFSSGGKFGWITNGNHLEVFNSRNGKRISSRTFGIEVKKKFNTIITAVCECSESPFLIVATVTDDPYVPGSLVCLFNARTSQVAKVITVPYEVTSLEFLCNHSDVNIRTKLFDGIAALGTYNGHIYLLDLKLSEHSVTSEKNPGSIVKDENITRLLKNEQHAAVWLEAQKTKNSDFYISSLKYIKKTSLLAVGFSSGVLELWDLKSLNPVFSNFIGEPRKGILVSHIVFQEPENDPKNVCYLWVVYTPSQGSPKSIGQVFLLQMVFNERSFIKKEGYIYDGFSSAFLRFSHPLCSSLDSHFMSPTKLLTCTTLSSGSNESFEISEDGGCNEDDLLCLIWQESVEYDIPRLYLLSFDLNKWYHCQMPSSIESGHLVSTSDMMIVHKLEELSEHEDVLHIRVEVNVATENKDYGGVLPLADYELTAITLLGLVSENIFSTATQLTHEIEKCPHVLFDKTLYYEMCYQLRDFCYDNSTAVSFTETSEHFFLLSVILDHNAISVMVAMVRQMAFARLTAVETFLTLEQVIDWSKHYLLKLKKNFNDLIIPLLESGPIEFDKQSLRDTNNCKQAIKGLVVVLSEVAASANAVLDEAKPKLYSYMSLAMHIEKFVVACTWFINADPMWFCHGAMIGGKLSNQLPEDYNRRRQQLKESKLMIDCIISEEGVPIKNHLKKFSNSLQYPLTNLETLVGLYLIPDANMKSKHFISLYFLEDLLDGTSEEIKCVTLSTFASQLNVPQELSQLVRASWFLDHQQFKESFNILKNLSKDKSVRPQLYSNLVRGFLEGKQLDSALMLSRKYLLPIENEETCCVYLQAMAVNGKITEAYNCVTQQAVKYKDCFAKVIAKYGAGAFLKEVLKTPILGDERCQIYFETFKNASVDPVGFELFMNSELKAKTSKDHFMISNWRPQTRKDEILRNIKPLLKVEATAPKCNLIGKKKTEKLKNSKDAAAETMFRTERIIMRPKRADEDAVDEAYLEPRTFEAEYMEFLAIPIIQHSSPKAVVNIPHSSILSRPRSASSFSGESFMSSKQIRFAEPEQNTYHFIDDKSLMNLKENFNDTYPPIEEESENEEDNNLETTLHEDSDNDETQSHETVKTSEEVRLEQEDDINSTFTYVAATTTTAAAATITTTAAAATTTTTSAAAEIRMNTLLEETYEDSHSVDLSNINSMSDDQVSVSGTEISETESFQASEVSMDTLKRPPLRRSRKSQGPSTPIRRSIRLRSFKLEDEDMDSIITPQEFDTKENDSDSVKNFPISEEAKTPVKTHLSNSRNATPTKKTTQVSRRSQAKDETEEVMKTPDKIGRGSKRLRTEDESEELMKTPDKIGRGSKRLRTEDESKEVMKTPDKIGRGSKRLRTEDESEEVAKTPGKQKRSDENLQKTPSKTETNEKLVIVKTPRSCRKIDRETVEDSKKIDSPSRMRKESTTSTTTTTSSSSIKIKASSSSSTITVEVPPTKIVLNDEVPLTPAQKVIRMKRALREQAAVKKTTKRSKETQEGIESRDVSLSETINDAESECSKPAAFVFSPPLTRARQRRESKSTDRII